MNETPNQNRFEPKLPSGESENRPSEGGFKVHIDERDLMTGSFTPPREQYAYQQQPYREQALTEKERRAEKKAHKKRNKIKARKNKRIFSLVWLCMVLLVAFTLASYLVTGANDLFAVGRNEGTTEVTIPQKLDAAELSDILYQRGAISKPEFFELYAKLTVDDWSFSSRACTKSAPISIMRTSLTPCRAATKPERSFRSRSRRAATP